MPSNSHQSVYPATWQEILDVVRKDRELAAVEGGRIWYRGHRDAQWRLSSVLHRYIDELLEGGKAVRDEEKRAVLVGEYKTLYRRSKAEASTLLRVGEQSSWGLIFAMQHFGIPSRLLDWSESFACALFFAQHRRNRNEDAAVWMGDSFAPLESQYQWTLGDQSFLKKVIIPPQLADDADEYLAQAGITPAVYYPDLQGIAMSHLAIKEENIRKKRQRFPQFFS